MAKTNEVAIIGNELAKESAWIASREIILRNASEIKLVENDYELRAAGNLQTTIAKHIKALNTERLNLTRRLDAIKKDIMNQEREMCAELSAELDRVKRLNDAYATRIAAEAAAERRRIQEEIDARNRAAAEAQLEAQEAFGDGVVVEPEPEPEPTPVMAKKPKLDANRIVKRWTFTIIDLKSVPREFLIANEPAIRAHVAYCDKIGRDPEIPGVSFQVRMSVESR